MVIRILDSRAWLAAAQATLIVLMILSALQLGDAQSSLEDSARNKKLAVKLASQVKQLRAMKSVANDDEKQVRVDNLQVVELAKMCGVSELQIASIQRLGVEHVENTEYERHDTSLRFRTVTMRQLLQMGLVIERERTFAKVTAIYLTNGRQAPQDDSSEDLWDAELILTQLLYVARSSADKRQAG